MGRSRAAARLALALALALAAVVVAFAAVGARGFDYGDALGKSLFYFEAQRSGRLPYGQRVTWRGHSGLADGLEQGVDLVGGYYDAGDHVKFGLPMAFTITMLSWGVLEYMEELAVAGQLGHAMEAIKWGTDYFVKAHTHPNVLWAQVGDGGTDHYCWQRPEDMTTSRRAYRLDEESPGSEVAGETAAAMAAASIVFLESDRRYSQLLLHHAQQLFEFADKYRMRYDESIPAAKHYYSSMSGYNDELLWAALWLHRATRAAGTGPDAIQYYLDFVVKNAFELGGAGWAVSEFSWDIKYPGLQILAAKLILEGGELEEEHRWILDQYRSKAEYYLCSCLNNNTGDDANVRRTPGGLLYVRRWNNMQYVVGATLLATIYSDYLRQAPEPLLRCPTGKVTPNELLLFSKSQVDYILGSNPMRLSYLVGFGGNYPRQVHHRSASAVPYKQSKGFVGCMQGYYSWYGRQADNLNVLVGAVVGGPDSEDHFRDLRGNFMQTEACTYNTAPLVGVLAKLHQLQEKLGLGGNNNEGELGTTLVDSQ